MDRIFPSDGNGMGSIPVLNTILVGEDMKKVENVVRYYALCNKLKDLVRTGWLNWNVSRDRIESVAEHIFGVEMLAIAMKSEYGYDVDLEKVILMLAVHELEEIYIGDFTPFQISREEKEKMGHEAVEKVLDGLLLKDEIKKLILEFDERKTKEALFAYYCDKLECDLQCKIYDESSCVNLDKEMVKRELYNPDAKEMYEKGASWSDMWISNDQKRCSFDENFNEVAEYIKNEGIVKYIED